MITSTGHQQGFPGVLLGKGLSALLGRKDFVAAEQGESQGNRRGAGVLLPVSPCRLGFVAGALWHPCLSEHGTTAILLQL